jgi:hypothetical protein
MADAQPTRAVEDGSAAPQTTEEWLDYWQPRMGPVTPDQRAQANAVFGIKTRPRVRREPDAA